MVWWEPGSGGGLALDEKPRYGLRRQELIVKDVPRDVRAASRAFQSSSGYSYNGFRIARTIDPGPRKDGR